MLVSAYTTADELQEMSEIFGFISLGPYKHKRNHHHRIMDTVHCVHQLKFKSTYIFHYMIISKGCHFDYMNSF